MTPFENTKCAVCHGVVYKEAHFTAYEDGLTIYLGSNSCVIALARTMYAGASLKEATEI